MLSRRAFLKGAIAAAAASALVPIVGVPKVTSSIEEWIGAHPIRGSRVITPIDLTAPSRLIYPVYTPLRNRLTRG